MPDEALIRAMQEAKPEEKEAAMLLMKRATTAEETAAVALLLISGRRRRQQHASDHLTDPGRRKTMPARIPIETARRYEACAERRHLAVYAWVREALERQYRWDTYGREAERRRRRKPRPGQREKAPPAGTIPWD